ncbi:hypothetical protein [Niveispirillum sp. KHB5.9]|uniref:hypothetical protein n=1 Tax=Niveispirillum sp. KHB5.9 TaxID=3400269 RepID=UPI003A87FA7A
MARTGRFILTSERGEKISAVEGLALSPRMAATLRQGAAQGLSGDERRAMVLETLRRK